MYNICIFVPFLEVGKVIRKKISAVLALTLVALVMLSGCGYNPPTVGTIDGVDVTCGQYLYFQLISIDSAATEYGDSTISGAAIFDVDIDGTPAREWIAQNTVKLCSEYIYVEKEFERLGLQFDDYTSYIVEYSASTNWQTMGNTYLNNGVGYETYESIVANSYKQSMVMQALYGEGGEREIPAEDKQAYFEENYTRADYIMFPNTDAYGYQLSSLDAVRASATAIYEASGSVEDMQQAFIDTYGEVYAATGEDSEASAETFSSKFLQNILVNTDTSSLDANLIADMLANRDGQFHLYDVDGVICVYRSKGLSDTDSAESNDETIVSAMCEEPYLELKDSTISSYTVNLDNRAVGYYSLDKVKF